MNANIAFWVYAYVLTLIAIGVAYSGIGPIKWGDVETHRKRMTLACNLILAFVASYVVKILVLKREDKTDWETSYLIVLYIHEALIGGMLATGVTARVLAYKFRESLSGGQPSELDLARRKKHALFGKLCIGFAVCALVTAAIVLFGMFGRL